jgi:hypothetical protein
MAKNLIMILVMTNWVAENLVLGVIVDVLKDVKGNLGGCVNIWYSAKYFTDKDEKVQVT